MKTKTVNIDNNTTFTFYEKDSEMILHNENGPAEIYKNQLGFYIHGEFISDNKEELDLFQKFKVFL